MKIDMLCNAHLDPVWQWSWEEGAAQAVSTFRAAADLCEEYEGFIFNHNESILYEWVEEYEPELFKRIQKLVKKGRWHIMGGWYLQPDMNMPSGESIFRQIETGLNYFQKKFGVRPTTAINFDSFGHSRGAVQIFAMSGYDSYIFMRPEENLAGRADEKLFPLEQDNFIWRGFDGSEILAHRIRWGYNTLLGKAAKKIESYMNNRICDPGFVFWGVGNHGGGPSRKDIEDLNKLIEEAAVKGIELRHSSAESYFEKLRTSHSPDSMKLPVIEKSLRPTMVGCYTSQVLIKQKHRELENLLYSTEKMATTACAAGLISYPHEEFLAAQKRLLTSQFHDILPGTSVQTAEQTSLQMISGGLDILSKIRARAFFALCSGLPKAEEGVFPILVFNTHPYSVNTCIDCEYQLADQNWSEDEFFIPDVYKNGELLASQLEKEAGNIPIDWRKRVVFEAVLEPLAISRFDVRHKTGPSPQPPGNIQDVTKAVKNCPAVKLAVIKDNEDPWGMTVTAFDDIEGYFEPASTDRVEQIMGTQGSPCHIVEDGPVRTVLETILEYKTSSAVLTWYLYKNKKEIDLNVRLFWNEKDHMVKLLLNPGFEIKNLITQEMYGASDNSADIMENVCQKWMAAADHNTDESDGKLFAVLNEGSHGFSCLDGNIALTLLRSPAYTAHPIDGRSTIAKDRFTARIDQSERLFNFSLVKGKSSELRPCLDAMALEFNEKPFALSFFPGGLDRPKVLPPLVIDNKAVILSSLRMREDGTMTARIYNSTDKSQDAVLQFAGQQQKITLTPWKIEGVVPS